MSEPSWTTQEKIQIDPPVNRAKFMVGGLLMFGAVIFLIYNGVMNNMQLFLTVDEFYERQAELGDRELRVSGWVIGESIRYTQIDATTSRLEFEIVDNLSNPYQSLHIIAMNEPKPDLLQHEAQALIEGRIGPDGNFYVNPGGLMLKCPTRYEELDAEKKQ